MRRCEYAHPAQKLSHSQMLLCSFLITLLRFLALDFGKYPQNFWIHFLEFRKFCTSFLCIAWNRRKYKSKKLSTRCFFLYEIVGKSNRISVFNEIALTKMYFVKLSKFSYFSRFFCSIVFTSDHPTFCILFKVRRHCHWVYQWWHWSRPLLLAAYEDILLPPSKIW